MAERVARERVLVRHKDFSGLYGQESGKGASASEAPTFSSAATAARYSPLAVSFLPSCRQPRGWSFLPPPPMARLRLALEGASLPAASGPRYRIGSVTGSTTAEEAPGSHLLHTRTFQTCMRK